MRCCVWPDDKQQQQQQQQEPQHTRHAIQSADALDQQSSRASSSFDSNSPAHTRQIRLCSQHSLAHPLPLPLSHALMSNKRARDDGDDTSSEHDHSTASPAAAATAAKPRAGGGAKKPKAAHATSSASAAAASAAGSFGALMTAASAPSASFPNAASAGSVKKETKSDSNRTDYLSRMEGFWESQLAATQAPASSFLSVKPTLPLARIKKIMKSDEDVRASIMISGEAPLLLCKACELFTLDLTMRAWAHTDATNRRTLQRSDVADAVATAEQFDFLLDTVPRDETAVAQHVPVRGHSSLQPAICIPGLRPTLCLLTLSSSLLPRSCVPTSPLHSLPSFSSVLSARAVLVCRHAQISTSTVLSSFQAKQHPQQQQPQQQSNVAVARPAQPQQQQPQTQPQPQHQQAPLAVVASPAYPAQLAPPTAAYHPAPLPAASSANSQAALYAQYLQQQQHLQQQQQQQAYAAAQHQQQQQQQPGGVAYGRAI